MLEAVLTHLTAALELILPVIVLHIVIGKLLFVLLPHPAQVKQEEEEEEEEIKQPARGNCGILLTFLYYLFKKKLIFLF